jgi:YHS domain-containing protein
MAIDPVCGMEVEEKTAEGYEPNTSQYGGQTFYFCSQECRRRFEQAPQQYARKLA